MNTDEIFANRRAIATDICRSIRKNGGQLLNAKFFLERPYSDGKHSYKFSSANILRPLLRIMVCRFVNIPNRYCLKSGLNPLTANNLVP